MNINPDVLISLYEGIVGGDLDATNESNAQLYEILKSDPINSLVSNAAIIEMDGISVDITRHAVSGMFSIIRPKGSLGTDTIVKTWAEISDDVRGSVKSALLRGIMYDDPFISAHSMRALRFIVVEEIHKALWKTFFTDVAPIIESDQYTNVTKTNILLLFSDVVDDITAFEFMKIYDQNFTNAILSKYILSDDVIDQRLTNAAIRLFDSSTLKVPLMYMNKHHQAFGMGVSKILSLAIYSDEAFEFFTHFYKKCNVDILEPYIHILVENLVSNAQLDNEDLLLNICTFFRSCGLYEKPIFSDERVRGDSEVQAYKIPLMYDVAVPFLLTLLEFQFNSDVHKEAFNALAELCRHSKDSSVMCIEYYQENCRQSEINKEVAAIEALTAGIKYIKKSSALLKIFDEYLKQIGCPNEAKRSAIIKFMSVAIYEQSELIRNDSKIIFLANFVQYVFQSYRSLIPEVEPLVVNFSLIANDLISLEALAQVYHLLVQLPLDVVLQPNPDTTEDDVCQQCLVSLIKNMPRQLYSTVGLELLELFHNNIAECMKSDSEANGSITSSICIVFGVLITTINSIIDEPVYLGLVDTLWNAYQMWGDVGDNVVLTVLGNLFYHKGGSNENPPQWVFDLMENQMNMIDHLSPKVLSNVFYFFSCIWHSYSDVMMDSYELFMKLSIDTMLNIDSSETFDAACLLCKDVISALKKVPEEFIDRIMLVYNAISEMRVDENDKKDIKKKQEYYIPIMCLTSDFIFYADRNSEIFSPRNLKKIFHAPLGCVYTIFNSQTFQHFVLDLCERLLAMRDIPSQLSGSFFRSKELNSHLRSIKASKRGYDRERAERIMIKIQKT